MPMLRDWMRRAIPEASNGLRSEFFHRNQIQKSTDAMPPPGRDGAGGPPLPARIHRPADPRGPIRHRPEAVRRSRRPRNERPSGAPPGRARRLQFSVPLTFSRQGQDEVHDRGAPSEMPDHHVRVEQEVSHRPNPIPSGAAGPPGVPEPLDLLRRVSTILATPCARRSLDRLDLPQLRKPRPYGLFNEPAAPPGGYELPHKKSPAPLFLVATKRVADGRHRSLGLEEEIEGRDLGDLFDRSMVLLLRVHWGSGS